MLFEHQGRNVVLTKSGRVFLEHVNRILEEVHIAEHKMKQLAGSGGHIDIAYVFPLANYYIPHTRPLLPGSGPKQARYLQFQPDAYRRYDPGTQIRPPRCDLWLFCCG